MVEKHICIYHRSCNDGICAAAIVNLYLGPIINKSFIGLNYNDSHTFDITLIDNETTVWIVDFSFPMDKMWELNNRAKKVFWFDHHQTPLASLIDVEKMNNITRVLDVKRSGAGITWDSLYKSPRPKIVNSIEDRDLWKFIYEDTRVICEGFSSMALKPTDEIFEKLLSNNSESLAALTQIGTVFRINKNAKIERALNNGFYGKIKGRFAFFVNAVDDISEIGEAIYLSSTEPIVAVMYRFSGNDTVVVSLRSNKIDVEEIAKSFGGGGHMGAAGFSISFDWGQLNNKMRIEAILK